jgi:glucose-1-phosphate thymidylyltransferase
VSAHRVNGWWKDTGQLEDMLEANRLVLEDLESSIDGELIDSEVDGRVVIAPGARLERTVVRGPAVIDADADLRDAYIGPYTSIGRGVRVNNSEIEYSIVLANSSISDLGSRMERSLLGRDVTIVGGADRPRALQFLVGDHAEITMP